LRRLAPPVRRSSGLLPVSAVQLTAKAVGAVAPAVTVTVRGFGAVTLQLPATPVSWTVWRPTLSPAKVTPVLLLIVIGWLVLPSQVALSPSRARVEMV